MSSGCFKADQTSSARCRLVLIVYKINETQYQFILNIEVEKFTQLFQYGYVRIRMRNPNSAPKQYLQFGIDPLERKRLGSVSYEFGVFATYCSLIVGYGNKCPTTTRHLGGTFKDHQRSKI